MFKVLSKLSSMLLVVVFLAGEMTAFFVEEAQSVGPAKMSLAATALKDRQLDVSPQGHENGKDGKNNTRSGVVSGKSGKESLKFYNITLEESLQFHITDEPLGTEPVTTESGGNIDNKSATANVDKAVADKGRVKRSKMLMGEVSDAERESIKFELRGLMGLVEFLKDRELSPALDPPLGDLQTALDTLTVDADQLKARNS